MIQTPFSKWPILAQKDSIDSFQPFCDDCGSTASLVQPTKLDVWGELLYCFFIPFRTSVRILEAILQGSELGDPELCLPSAVTFKPACCHSCLQTDTVPSRYWFRFPSVRGEPLLGINYYILSFSKLSVRSFDVSTCSRLRRSRLSLCFKEDTECDITILFSPVYSQMEESQQKVSLINLDVLSHVQKRFNVVLCLHVVSRISNIA